jgi:lipoate-protein ligase A
MLLWVDGAYGAAENMRRDSARLEWLEQGNDARATLRLYRFDPPGITLGHLQDPLRELDADRCRAAGIEWAVRPTGGRAIFHAEEWTYSFAARLDDPRWGGTLDQSYAAVGALLLRSLLRLGVPAERAGEHRATGSGSERSAACFASTTPHEILLQGRKLVGSAQRRLRRAFLQQGSLLLGPAHLRLTEFLRVPEESRERLRAALEARSALAGPWLGVAALEHWAAALVAEIDEPLDRLDGDAGLESLTLVESAPYTRMSPRKSLAPDRSRT